MAGDWQLDKKTIQIKVRAFALLIACLEMKIRFGDFDDNEIFGS